jgi:hypothetical protein
MYFSYTCSEVPWRIDTLGAGAVEGNALARQMLARNQGDGRRCTQGFAKFVGSHHATQPRTDHHDPGHIQASRWVLRRDGADSIYISIFLY